ncbi:MAG TPA: hypothetical protein VFJ58_10065 [Armatimonadota bacterium]|nr:hypothetical protein [Armatimonadota bacterium]
MYAGYSKAEIVSRGRAIYEQKLKARIGEQNVGKWLMIDVDSEDYDVDDDALSASGRLRERHPGAALYAMKIGEAVPIRIGARFARGKL